MRLDEAQAGIKISGRNINNLRHADDTTLMAEGEELRSLLLKVKEESEKSWLKTHQPRLDAWDKRSDLVHWEDLEGAGGEGGGRGDRDGEHM